MARLSSQLPNLGALVLAVVVAAVAYSVYDHGQSSSPGGPSHGRGAGLAAADLTTDSAVAPKPQSGGDSKSPRPTADGHVRAAASASGTEAAPVPVGPPALGGPLLQPVASEPPVPHSRPKPDGGSRFDRELQRLIDGPGRPKSKPKPRSPKNRAPVAPAPAPAPPNVGPPAHGAPSSPSPQPTDPAPAPTDPGATPTDPGATPTDPEADLDDLPVGGLDETDLGEPVDETDTGTNTAAVTGADTGSGSAVAAAASGTGGA